MTDEVIKLKKKDYPEFFDAYGITDDTAYFNRADFEAFIEDREHNKEGDED